MTDLGNKIELTYGSNSAWAYIDNLGAVFSYSDKPHCIILITNFSIPN